MRKSGLLAVMAAGVLSAAPLMAEDHATPLIAQGCAGCHGQAGEGQGAAPRIAGRDRTVLLQTWNAFRDDERPATIMNRIASGYTEEEAAALADYFSSLR